MRWAVENLTVLMIVGIIVVVAVAQIHRQLGSVLGIAFWSLVAVIGSEAYAMGGGIALLSLKFSQPAFYGLCALLVLVNVATLVQAIRRSKRRGAPPSED